MNGKQRATWVPPELQEKARLRMECRECARLKAEFDADCNDCKHFARGGMLRMQGFNMFAGRCQRFEKNTLAYPGQPTFRSCFEPRRSEMPHTCVDFTAEEIDRLTEALRNVGSLVIERYQIAMEGIRP